MMMMMMTETDFHFKVDSNLSTLTSCFIHSFHIYLVPDIEVQKEKDL